MARRQSPKPLKNISSDLHHHHTPSPMQALGLAQPMSTVGQPIMMAPPCAVVSPCLAAGFPPISTVVDPIATTSGGPTHTHISPTTDAGIFPISTVGQPGPVTGPPTCGIGGRPGVNIGQTCMSPILAAGCDIWIKFSQIYNPALNPHTPLMGDWRPDHARIILSHTIIKA